MNEPRPTTVALPTLGCKANRYDSDRLAKALISMGYVIVPPNQAADVYIVNTCTVTGEADAKSRKMLRKSLKLNDAAALIVTGCYASLEPGKLVGIEGVDYVVPIAEQDRIPELVRALRPPAFVQMDIATGLTASIERTRATVKVQDGCNLQCAFCAVTLARGDVRSRPIAEVVDELRQLVEAGVKEIVLTGIRLDAYGMDLPTGQRLGDLVEATKALHIPRLRLSSLEPIGITERLAAQLAEHPALCHHFHVCLQSGDDGVLRAMRRGYTADEYLRKIELLRRAMADAAFTTDVIVGFPGESDAAFAATCALVETVGFSKLHIFQFSPRPGTAAATMTPQLPQSVKDARSRQLFAIEQRLFQQQASRLVGTRVPVLVERMGKAGEGLTPDYFRVLAPFTAIQAGEIIHVSITKVEDGCLLGEATD